MALNGIPEKDFVYPFKWFITNTTVRLFWWGEGLYAAFFLSKRASLSLSEPSLSNELAGKNQRGERT